VNVVSLVSVGKTFGSWPVLQGVDLEVGDGARIGIVGPNGAGKSTLLRILQGSEAATDGEVVRRKDLTIAFLEQHVDGDERTA
jgi:ATPase subunit of ABC transporter with duplicated ATPase domains